MDEVPTTEPRMRRRPSAASAVFSMVVASVILAAFFGVWFHALAEIFEWGWDLIEWN
jgi:hypothetical protein